MCLIPETQKLQQNLSDHKLFSRVFRVMDVNFILRLLVMSHLTKLSLDGLVRACQHLMFCANMNEKEFCVLLDLDVVNIWTCQRTNLILLYWRRLFFNGGFRFLRLSLVFLTRACPGVDLLSCLNDPGVPCCMSPLVRHSPGLPGGKKCDPECFRLSSLSHAWLAKSESKTPKAFNVCYLLTMWHDSIDSFSDCTKSLFWSSETMRACKMLWSILTISSLVWKEITVWFSGISE